jgi:hypothetical protein
LQWPQQLGGRPVTVSVVGVRRDWPSPSVKKILPVVHMRDETQLAAIGLVEASLYTITILILPIAVRGTSQQQGHVRLGYGPCRTRRRHDATPKQSQDTRPVPGPLVSPYQKHPHIPFDLRRQPLHPSNVLSDNCAQSQSQGLP